MEVRDGVGKESGEDGKRGCLFAVSPGKKTKEEKMLTV